MNSPAHVETTMDTAYCSVLAREKGLDPVGYGGMADGFVVLEAPLAWPRAVFAEPEKVTPQFIQVLQHYHALPEAERPRMRPVVVAPDQRYSQPGYRRLMLFTREPGLVAGYDRIEWLAPEADYGRLVWAALVDRDKLAEFDSSRIQRGPNDNPVRDVLVCTHGTVDVACAKFGYPLYKHLADRYASDTLRVWRCSHFGGHVFAPTLIDLPTGHYWAYVEPPQAEQIARRNGDPCDLRSHYRGWSALNHSFLQAAEREAFLREGWRWLDYRKMGWITAQDQADEPGWGEVRLSFISPDGAYSGEYEARVEVGRYVTTISTSNDDHTHAYAQYQVASMRLLAR
jgi:hypothetical protein